MKKKRPSKPADDRHARFVAEYLKTANATQAAITAGYSKKTAKVQGSRLLTNAAIAAAIAKAQAARAERTGITQDRVLYELEHLAFSNITHYTTNERDELVLAVDAPKDAMKAVSSFRRKPGEFGTEIEIKLWDKPGTLKLAGRHVGLFPDRIELTGKDGGPLITAAAAAKLTDDELKIAMQTEAARLLAAAEQL